MANKNYDYTPVPSYVPPTEGNMQQAAVQIANWIRSKGSGDDTREAMAQAVQLFGDVAAQFIKQSEGLKGQFSSAIAGANANSEVAASHSSTTTGKSYTSLPDRLDAIDAEQVSHENELAAARQSYGNLGDREAAQDNWIKDVQNSISDTGWLQNGMTLGSNVQSAPSLSYRIITIGSLQAMIINAELNVNSSALASAAWGSSGRILLNFPSGITMNNDQLRGPQRIWAGNDADVSPHLALRAMNDAIYFDDFVDEYKGSVKSQIMFTMTVFLMDAPKS